MTENLERDVETFEYRIWQLLARYSRILPRPVQTRLGNEILFLAQLYLNVPPEAKRRSRGRPSAIVHLFLDETYDRAPCGVRRLNLALDRQTEELTSVTCTRCRKFHTESEAAATAPRLTVVPPADILEPEGR